jgi:hypothetical protein
MSIFQDEVDRRVEERRAGGHHGDEEHERG